MGESLLSLALAMLSLIRLLTCNSWNNQVHCDPHPGNVLVRQHPNDQSRSQIVIIDHGLCIPLSEQFRSDYALLWRSLFVVDLPTIERIAVQWGISAENSDMLASATLLKPHRVRKQANTEEGKKLAKSTYEQQTGLKDRLRSMLQNEELIPRVCSFPSLQNGSKLTTNGTFRN